MLVILRENVENLGLIGDIVKVRDGYARNFLLPRNLVLPAGEENLKVIEHQKRLLEKKRLAQKANTKILAEKLNGLTITLTRKSMEGDKIFGSVTAAQIVEALEVAGFEISKKSVHLEHPIKALGAHPVTLHLDTDLQATITLSIIKEV